MPSHFFAILFQFVLIYHCFQGDNFFNANPIQKCDSSTCFLPDCFCSTTTPPLAVEDSPQIIMISFDGALTELIYTTYYINMFNMTNPDGCPIGLTFFLSHESTDYVLVNDVWNHGHEVASNSISDSMRYMDYQGWTDEMYGMKQIASNFGNISINDIVGSRSPYLQVYGDVQYQAQYDSGFVYDSTLTDMYCIDPPLFPFTLDYKPMPKCQIFLNLNNSYPGYWEVPLVAFTDTSNVPCAMLDACPLTNSTDDIYNFLLYNFNKHYNTNKAPFGLFTHASWFQTDASHWPAYLQFINYLGTLPDVYIMTVAKTIEWMKQPTAIADLPSFEPWACPSRFNSCFPKSSCYYNETSYHFMNVCGECPPHYPWVGDPYGNATLSRV